MEQAGDILSVLARKLPDEVLQEYFQGLSPGKVRKILQEAVAVLAPPKKAEVKPSSQASLWQDKARDMARQATGKEHCIYSLMVPPEGIPVRPGQVLPILDEQGNELVAAGKYLGQCTNNEAEYRALQFGPAKCGEFGKGRVEIHLDSELIVKQIHGKYRVKRPT